MTKCNYTPKPQTQTSRPPPTGILAILATETGSPPNATAKAKGAAECLHGGLGFKAWWGGGSLTFAGYSWCSVNAWPDSLSAFDFCVGVEFGIVEPLPCGLTIPLLMQSSRWS